MPSGRDRFITSFAAFLILASLLASCSKGYSRYLKLPSDPSTATGLGWAAVTSAYAQAKTLPDKRSADAVLVRRGLVFQIAERRIDPEGRDLGGLWYRYGDVSSKGAATAGGWLHASDLAIFASEEQARQALAALGTE